MELSKLEEAIRNSWDEKTTSDPDNWSPNKASWGQCAVTALVVQDYLGGEIVWTKVIFPDGKNASHYFNKLNGEEYDLTRDQFPKGIIVPKGEPRAKNITTRDYILSFPITLEERYKLLKQKVKKYLKE